MLSCRRLVVPNFVVHRLIVSLRSKHCHFFFLRSCTCLWPFLFNYPLKEATDDTNLHYRMLAFDVDIFRQPIRLISVKKFESGLELQISVLFFSDGRGKAINKEIMLSKRYQLSRKACYFLEIFIWNAIIYWTKNTYFGSAQVMMPEERKIVRGKLFQLKILNSDENEFNNA